ncbi:DUF418 domain-containing protein [Bacillus sp. PAMC26568]|nr:DUF418 domain-containing protein [Bacillus sp. PAMC26568]
MDAFKAVAKKDRLHSLDILRGFSLLGILLVNMKSFHEPVLYESSFVSSKYWSDRLIEQFINLFAQASFYPLFSFLFGAGTVIFYERAKEKGQSFNRYYSKRLIGLLIIGAIHAAFIWHGDILTNYAIIGFIFMIFLKWSTDRLWKWALWILILPNVLMSLLLFFAYAGEPASLSLNENGSQQSIQQSLEVYQTGSFLEVTQQRLTDWAYVNNPANGIFLVLSILPLFMLGASAYKRGWFHQSKVQEWKQAALLSGAAAAVFKGLPYYWEENVLTQHLQLSIGGPALTLCYVSIGLLVLDKWQLKLSPIRAIGRGSLSNYLLQSFICTLLFYSYGLGFYGEITELTGLILVVIIYGVQVALSHIWFKRFPFGPVEWLLRKWIYFSFRA